MLCGQHGLPSHLSLCCFVACALGLSWRCNHLLPPRRVGGTNAMQLLHSLLGEFSFKSAVVALAVVAVVYTLAQALRAIFFPPKPVVFRYKPAPVGQVTLLELSKYDGNDPYRPILFAVRGKVYDVTEARAFYGPGTAGCEMRHVTCVRHSRPIASRLIRIGGGYSVFAGREISRALGKMAISEAECNDKLEDLAPRELQTLSEWELKFKEKYTVVGEVRHRRCGCPVCQRTAGGRRHGRLSAPRPRAS